MNFKEMLAKDLDVFINEDEFAELHTLGIKETEEILMVVEENTFDRKKGLGNEYENTAQGIFESTTTIHMKSSLFKKPSVGTRLKLDGDYYYVVNATNSDGMLTIILSANES